VIVDVVQYGPAKTRVKSSTVMPDKALRPVALIGEGPFLPNRRKANLNAEMAQRQGCASD
jgi:hypothetical protein